MPPAWYRQALEASTLYTLVALSALFLLEGGSDISPSASRALQMQRFSVRLRYNPQLLVPLTESSLTSSFKPPTWLSRSSTSELVRDHGPLKAQIYGTVYSP